MRATEHGVVPAPRKTTVVPRIYGEHGRTRRTLGDALVRAAGDRAKTDHITAILKGATPCPGAVRR